jgi:hypothetical protein
MTQKRRDNHSTEFGLWLRDQREIDSSLGYVTTNIDYIWENYKTGEWMILEEKRYNSEVKFYQKRIFDRLDKVSVNDPNYKGVYIIVFENTSPEDGNIYINGTLSTKQDLLDLLQFKLTQQDTRGTR